MGSDGLDRTMAKLREASLQENMGYAPSISFELTDDEARAVLRELVMLAENAVIGAIAADFEASDAGKGISYAALKISKRIHDGHSCLLDTPSEAP